MQLKLSAQNIIVLDRINKAPVPSAHVHIKKADGTMENFYMTDTSGRISQLVDYQGQRIALKISFLGYKTYTDTILFKDNLIFYLEEESQVLNEVVVTAQYSPGNPENSVHRIRIIDQKKIELMNAQNLRDILSNELNIRISQDNILGSGMSMQGLSGENVKILIDGVPMIGRQNGNIDLSQINLNNIERIEIVEGPLSVNYGTNALAGTINLITKRDQQSRLNGKANAYYESIGTYNTGLRVGWNKQKHQLSFSGGRNFFDGWTSGENFSMNFRPSLADSSRFKSWKPREQYFGELLYGYKWKNRIFQYRGSSFQERITNRGMPRAPYGTSAFDDTYQTFRTDHSVQANGELTPRSRFTFLAAYNHYRRIKNTWFRDLTNLDKVLTENPGDQDTTIFTLFNTRANITTNRNGAKFNGEIGYDINYETTTGLRILNQNKTMGDYALFSTAEIRPRENIVFKPGLRYSYNSNYKAPLTPSLNLRVRIKEKINIRASWAQGFRAPSLKELYFFFVDINHNIQGNENLRAETSDNFSIGISYNHIYKKSITRIEGGIFYNHIQNMITLAFVQNTLFSYVNIGEFISRGFQLNAETSLGHFKFSSGYSYTQRSNLLSENLPIGKFSGTHELRSSTSFSWKKPDLRIALFYKYTGVLPGFYLNSNQEIVQSFINDFHMMDVTISKSFYKKRFNCSMGVKNLFDVRNINSMNVSSGAHSSGTGSMPLSTGRLFFAGIEFNFNSKR